MLDSGWPHSSKGWVPGSSGKGHVLPGRQWLCQEIHKDGVGCGLAEDEGSQGDQEDTITDQRPPAVGQRERGASSVNPPLTLQTLYKCMYQLIIVITYTTSPVGRARPTSK